MNKLFTVGAILLLLLTSTARAQRRRDKGVFAPTHVKTWRKALTVTTGDVVRVDCESETLWLTGAIPESRSWAITVKNEDATNAVYVRYRETSGKPPVDTSNVDTSGDYTDHLVAAGEQWSLPQITTLQIAIKQAAGTPTVRVDFECSGTPGY